MSCGCEKSCLTFMKFLFLIFNGIFFLLGLLMLGFGIALNVSPSSIFSISKSNAQLTTLLDFMAGSTLTGVGIFMIILGCVVTVLALIGFVACLAESKALLILFVIIIIIIMLVEIIIIIMLAGFPNKVKQFASSTIKLENKFSDDIQIYQNLTLSTPTDFLARKWAIIQTQLACCGINGPTDYQYFSEENRVVYTPTKQTSLVPLSCCSIFSDSVNTIPTSADLQKCANVQFFQPTNSLINNKGCYDAVQDLLITYWQIPIGIAAATIGLQVVLTVLTIIILCQIFK